MQCVYICTRIVATFTRILKISIKILLFFLVFASFLSSCKEPVEEIKETIFSAEDNAVAESEFAAIYDVIDDFVSTNMTATHILPNGTIILFHDTSFYDGDGQEFSIYFGELDSTYPLGVLCNDGKYRAGFLRVRVTTPFTTIGSVIEVEASHDECFYSGNGHDMFKVQGKIIATRAELNKVNIEVQEATLKGDDYNIHWQSDRTLEIVHDAGPGFWGDTYHITGTARGVNRVGQSFTVTIEEPLVKHMTQDCASTFTEGVLNVTVQAQNKNIIVDYDPFGDQACDKIVQAEINGKRSIFKVK